MSTLTTQEYVQGLAHTLLTIAAVCGSLVLAYRIVRFTSQHRAGQ